MEMNKAVVKQDPRDEVPNEIVALLISKVVEVGRPVCIAAVGKKNIVAII